MPLFSGFGAAALAARLEQGGAVAVITADGSRRRGNPTPMKAVVDEAAAKLTNVRHVVVLRQQGIDLETRPG